MGKKDTVCALTTEKGAMWIKLSTGSELGCALELAVQNDDLGLVEILLSHTQRSTVSKVMKVQTTMVVRGITHAVRSNEPIALVLLEWFISNAKHKEIQIFWGCFEEACASGMMDFDRNHDFSPQLFDVLTSFFLDTGLFDRSNVNSSE